MLLEIYHILEFAVIQLTLNSILTGDESFKKLNYKVILNLMGLKQVEKEYEFPQTVLVKRLSTKSQS